MTVALRSQEELAVISLALQDARDVIRRREWRNCPVGEAVAAWLDEVRLTLAATTRNAYEDVGSRLALRHAHYRSLREFDRERIVRFLIEEWGDAAKSTQTQRRAILRSFFRWAKDTGRVDANPAVDLPKIRAGAVDRNPLTEAEVQRLVSSQPGLREQVALQLLARMGLRKNELRLLQLKHIDLGRNVITVHGKGGKIGRLPIGFESLRQDMYLYVSVERGGGLEPGDEYLLYPRTQRRRPMTESTLQRWFENCLWYADLGRHVKMHELRHTAADMLWRKTGNLILAQQLLRHESVGTTQAYLHPSQEDLLVGMRTLDEGWK